MKCEGRNSVNIAELTVLSAALSIDAFGIGASCAVRGIKMPPVSKIVICAVSLAVTGLAAALGNVLSGALPAGTGTAIGAIMLIALGAYTAAGAFIEERRGRTASPDSKTPLGKTAEIIRDPAACDGDGSRSVDLREAAYIGAALSADSFSAGIGAAVGGSAALIPLLCGGFQLLLLCAGEFAGRFAGRRRGIRQLWLSLLSAAILVLTGILRFVV